MPPGRSFRATVAHPESATGRTHASSVEARVRSSVFESGTTTRLDVPLKDSAEPNFPAAHVALEAVPLLALPDASATAVPVFSSNPYAATRPAEGAAGATAPDP